MWIMHNNAFLSAVKDWGTEDGLVVRARNRQHLQEHFPHHEVHEIEYSDYQYRMFITKKEYADAVHASIMNIEYHNFKDSVEDDLLHSFYLYVWNLGRSYGSQSIDGDAGVL